MKMVWVGRIISALAVAPFFPSAYMKLSLNPEAVEGFAKVGFPDNVLLPIGVVELVCVILYIFPRTAYLGATLLTAYLGGAVVVHVRAGESFIIPVAIGILVWLGLYLRDARLRQLAPYNRY